MPNNIFNPYGGNSIYTGQGTSTSIPAYERVSSIPSWLPSQAANESELRDQYGQTNKMYDTSAFDAASEGQQSRILTTALNAGNNAAAEYANRARQSGGSALGAGLVKAEAQTGARATAGAMKLDQAKFDAAQREAAATHATQIATTLGQLRDSYLKSLVNYATSEDATMADYRAKMAAIDSADRNSPNNPRNKPRSGMYMTDRLGNVTNLRGNALDEDPRFNNTTGLLSFGGGG